MWGPAPGLAAGQAKILSMTSAAQFTRLPVVLPSRFLARAGSRYAAPASPFFCHLFHPSQRSKSPPILVFKFPTPPCVQMPQRSNSLAFKFPTPPSGQIEFHTPPSNLTSHPLLAFKLPAPPSGQIPHPSQRLNFPPLLAFKFPTPPSV